MTGGMLYKYCNINSLKKTYNTIQYSTTTVQRKIMGVTKEVLKEGNGSKPSAGQEVTVHCTGYGKNRDLTKVFWCKLYSSIVCSTVVTIYLKMYCM